jgi:hypothetical protein
MWPVSITKQIKPKKAARTKIDARIIIFVILYEK